MNYFKISLGVFIALAVSRFIPHPPNFTSLLALSFYVPALFGIRYLPALLVSFVITDFFIGFHSSALFTWGSIMFIGLLSQYFIKNISLRISGALIGACLFYVITNFGVWSLGSYGHTFEGLVTCYTLAIPFFAYSIISTLVFSTIIETVIARKYLIKKIFNQ
jgi:hypothetical protein